MHKKKVLDVQTVFNFWFFMNLPVLRCPEYSLTIFGKYLFARDTKFVAIPSSRNNVQNFMKYYA